MDYSQYLELMEKVTKEGKSTAPEHNEDLAQFSKLNLSRTQRWHKKPDYSKEDFPAISNYDKPLVWLLITESWCGDAAHSCPIIAELAELNAEIDVKVVLRDQNLDLMDQFLTNGGRSIPKLIMYDPENQEVKATWGPRPKDAAKLFADYKEDDSNFKDDLKTTLQKWYNKDKGVQTSSEIEAVMNSLN
jgi:thiol-disulfide isomerase/thioredoxin